MKVEAYVPDLMDRSRLDAAGASAGAEVSYAPSPDRLSGEADLVVVDLTRAGVLEALPNLGGAATVGFASHVDRDLLRRARAAGCQTVLARSAFFGRLGPLLAGRGVQGTEGQGAPIEDPGVEGPRDG